MFDFEKLEVYKQAKQLNKEILQFLRDNKNIDSYIRDQLRRASISIVINIAEGSGKFTKAGKRNLYTVSRASVYECVSLFEIIFEEEQIIKNRFDYFYSKLETISKMLFGLIKNCR